MNEFTYSLNHFDGMYMSGTVMIRGMQNLSPLVCCIIFRGLDES